MQLRDFNDYLNIPEIFQTGLKPQYVDVRYIVFYDDKNLYS